jgi:hypothetical protein
MAAYYFIIDADLEKHPMIKNAIESMIGNPDLGIDCITSTRSLIDFQSAADNEWDKHMNDEESWGRIAGCCSAD